MTWLADGSMLVTEKSGVLYHIKNKTKSEIGNVPKVVARGQGGLLDITVHPKYKENGWIYIAYSSDNPIGSNTKIIRAKLQDEKLVTIETIYETTLERLLLVILVVELFLTMMVICILLLVNVEITIKIRKILLEMVEKCID